jgi:methylated-DNA-[protein]-cysteine S-methyltransferase
MRFHVFQTAAGFCAVAWGEAGIARYHLPVRSAEAAERSLRRRLPDAAPATPDPEVAAAIAAVRRYFAGEQADLSAIRLDLGTQDPFFARVYAAVRRLGRGETTTYGALDRDLGAGPEAARDVGRAMATNPLPLLVPCHRVLAANGRLGGFSAPGGAATKRRMLELEGVRLDDPAARQPSFGF